MATRSQPSTRTVTRDEIIFICDGCLYEEGASYDPAGTLSNVELPLAWTEVGKRAPRESAPVWKHYCPQCSVNAAEVLALIQASSARNTPGVHLILRTATHPDDRNKPR